MLASRRLSAGYNRRTVVSKIDIEVNTGEVVCLLGANGSGKTTLFKAILGLIPMEGELFLDNRSVKTYTRRECARLMACVPQTHSSPFPFKALDIVLMGRSPHIDSFAIPSHEDKLECMRIMASLQIGHLALRHYDELSGGERQLVLIARALAQSPRFLLMDEPTSHLDFGNQMRTLGLISSLAATGIGIILTTHSPDHAFICASKVLALHNGEIMAQGRPEEVITPALLEKMYGFEIDVVPQPSGRCMCSPVLKEVSC